MAEPANNAFQSIKDLIYLEKTYSVYILNMLSSDRLVGMELVPFNFLQIHSSDKPSFLSLSELLFPLP